MQNNQCPFFCFTTNEFQSVLVIALNNQFLLYETHPFHVGKYHESCSTNKIFMGICMTKQCKHSGSSRQGIFHKLSAVRKI